MNISDSCADVVETETSILHEVGKKRKLEDSIPVIEIRGEGQPMTAAQIRQLEEMSNGGPLDIKVKGYQSFWHKKCIFSVQIT